MRRIVEGNVPHQFLAYSVAALSHHALGLPVSYQQRMRLESLEFLTRIRK